MAMLKNPRSTVNFNTNLLYIFACVNLVKGEYLCATGLQRCPTASKLKGMRSPKETTVIKKMILKIIGGFCSTNAGASGGKSEKSRKVSINSTFHRQREKPYRISD